MLWKSAVERGWKAAVRYNPKRLYSGETALPPGRARRTGIATRRVA